MPVLLVVYLREQEGQIIEEFVKTGRSSSPTSTWPSLAVNRCRRPRAPSAPPNRTSSGISSTIFHLQAREGQVSDEKIDVGRLSDDKLARASVGVNRDQWQQCFESQDTLGAVQADEAEARSFGIRGTPGFSINGQALGGGAPANMDGWRTIFEQRPEGHPDGDHDRHGHDHDDRHPHGDRRDHGDRHGSDGDRRRRRHPDRRRAPPSWPCSAC